MSMREEIELGTTSGAFFQLHIATRRLWIAILKTHPMLILTRALAHRILDDVARFQRRKG